MIVNDCGTFKTWQTSYLRHPLQVIKRDPHQSRGKNGRSESEHCLLDGRPLCHERLPNSSQCKVYWPKQARQDQRRRIQAAESKQASKRRDAPGRDLTGTVQVKLRAEPCLNHGRWRVQGLGGKFSKHPTKQIYYHQQICHCLVSSFFIN